MYSDENYDDSPRNTYAVWITRSNTIYSTPYRNLEDIINHFERQKENNEIEVREISPAEIECNECYGEGCSDCEWEGSIEVETIERTIGRYENSDELIKDLKELNSENE